MVAIGKTNPFMSQFAVSSYSQAKPINMNAQDVTLANKGWRFTQPDRLAEGFNPFSNGNCGGGLNLIANYSNDADGYTIAQETTTFWVA